MKEIEDLTKKINRYKARQESCDHASQYIDYEDLINEAIKKIEELEKKCKNYHERIT